MCISPKPGFSENTIRDCADEIKVIVPGLGELTERLSAELGTKTRDFRWPTIEDALRWARTYKRPVFLQPRNAKYDVDKNNLMIVQDIIRDNPELRLSVQLHKILRVQ